MKIILKIFFDLLYFISNVRIKFERLFHFERKNVKGGEKMKKQAFNPYLPSYEYIPDGEPHVFGDRVYLYGSHDKFDGNNFCLLDYVCWSAPVTDLSDWRKEGTTLTKTQDPENPKGKYHLFAPDVCKGPDGRYYMYYFTSFNNKLCVAVCDTPAGKYEFLDFVHYPDGTPLGEKKDDIFQFDPSVYTENGKVYLYSGFCPSKLQPHLSWGRRISKNGPICAELLGDMVTVIGKPKFIGVKCLSNSKGTPYEGHEFFEASSMRKIKDKYYFIYSSFLGHELCYAIGDAPDGEFAYGGTIVSIGDVGLRGIKGVKDAENYLGNTHGSLIEINGKYYVFYHRQTNGHCFSRQGCAEEIKIEEDGSIRQVEITSCGLNGGPLSDHAKYEAGIAAILKSPKGGKFYLMFKDRSRPYITQTGSDRERDPEQYIAHISDGTVIGYKYFMFATATKIVVSVRGNASGELIVSNADGGNPIAKLQVSLSKGKITKLESPLHSKKGRQALFFTYRGTGTLDLFSFELN